jgi:hypothetical protein
MSIGRFRPPRRIEAFAAGAGFRYNSPKTDRERQMSRLLRALGLVFLVASCAAGSAPRNLENACALAREKPAYARAMKATAAEWGVPVHVQMATIYHESRFIRNARTPRRFALGFIPAGRQSSAYGYAQALDGTWDDYRRETRNSGARRDRIEDATDFIGWYMDTSARELGISKSDATTQYLAYHEGRAGYARGSHTAKPWLVSRSREVGRLAARYQQQLEGCRI